MNGAAAVRPKSCLFDPCELFDAEGLTLLDIEHFRRTDDEREFGDVVTRSITVFRRPSIGKASDPKPGRTDEKAAAFDVLLNVV